MHLFADVLFSDLDNGPRLHVAAAADILRDRTPPSPSPGPSQSRGQSRDREVASEFCFMSCRM